MSGSPVHFGTSTLAVQGGYPPAEERHRHHDMRAGASEMLDSDPNNFQYGYEQLWAIRVGAVH